MFPSHDPKPRQQTFSKIEDIMEDLGLTEKDVNLAGEAEQEELSEEDKKKQDLINSIT